MQTRTIAIADTKTQKRYNIETSASTLGELQDQMALMGISFAGMSFTEGISKTQLLTRDTQLPTNVMYKGQPTNNLVILLTNTTKQIASGAPSRKELYTIIKERNLQQAIKDYFGDNYTHVSTTNLTNFLGDATDESKEETTDQPQSPAQPTNDAPHADLVEWFYLGVKYLTKINALYPEDVAVIADLVTELAARLKESQPFSQEDIDDIVNAF